MRNVKSPLPVLQIHLKRNILVLLFAAVVCAGRLAALDGAFAGIGPEINGYSRKGIALGGGLGVGMDINRYFAAGMKTSFFHNLDTVSALEPLAFFRYYFPLQWPGEADGPFLQAELGAIVFFEYGEVFPAFSGSLAAGWRFCFAQNWYVEPALRLGYPHIWGFNVMAGIRLKTKIQNVIVEVPVIETVTETVVETVNETIIEPVPVEVLVVPEDDKLRIYTPPIIFRADHADFEGLSDEIIADNTRTLTHIAGLLDTFKDYRIEVEGYANPTTPEGPARRREEPILLRLSEERARIVVEELARLGADPGRLSYLGAGSPKKIENSWRNRKVEFMLIKQAAESNDVESNDMEEKNDEKTIGNDE